jgi:multidrug resistance efflux pump
VSFPRTHALIHSPVSPGRLALGAGIAVYVAAWTFWFFGSELDQVERAIEARIEVAGAVHRVEAPEAGLLAAVHVRLGERVRAGQPLAEIDTHHQRSALREIQAELAAARARVEALERQIDGDRRLASEEERALEREAGHLETRLAAAEVAASYARQEADRVESAARSGVVSGLERHRSQALAAQREAEVEVARADLERVRAEAEVRRRQIRGRAERLAHDLETALGSRETLEARRQTLLAEVEERRLEAAVDGVVGAVLGEAPGVWIERGTTLVEIVPDQEVRIVARFDPRVAGRLRPGQVARIRARALPPTEQALGAVVERVASEPEPGGLRVELGVDEHSAPRARHGLAADVEVVVDTVSPFVWTLRAARRIGRT